MPFPTAAKGTAPTRQVDMYIVQCDVQADTGVFLCCLFCESVFVTVQHVAMISFSVVTQAAVSQHHQPVTLLMTAETGRMKTVVN